VSVAKNTPPLSDPDVERSLALEMLLDAWDTALDEGISADVLATTAIFAALTDMIDLHGEEIAAQMAESLPARIRAGEFTLSNRN
jgi:hypothetical protein